MSHFAVLVIGSDPEKQLAPYQENNMGDCPAEYMEFNDIEDEYKDKYENDTVDEWYPEARKELDRAVYDQLKNTASGQNIEVEVTGIIFDKVERGNRISFRPKRSQLKDGEHVKLVYGKCLSILENQPNDPADTCTDGKILVEIIEAPKEIPLKDKYTDFEEFMKQYCGSVRNSEGKHGYWENPNAKWDWYQLGGRWNGYFMRKDGSKTVVGQPGVFGSHREDYSDRCDQGLKSDIDFQGMYDEAADAAHKEYDEVLALFKSIGMDEIPKLEFTFESTWDKGNPYNSKEERIAAYDAQDAFKAWDKLRKEHPKKSEAYDKLTPYQQHFLHGFTMGAPLLERFQCTRTQYAARAMDSCISSYAIIKDGKWYQKGEMGWWGMSSDEMSQEDWNKKVRELIEEASEDTLFSLYDCHI